MFFKKIEQVAVSDNWKHAHWMCDDDNRHYHYCHYSKKAKYISLIIF